MNTSTKKNASTDANPFFGVSMPRVDAKGLTGSLIAIEGADGSGRSTQIALLQEWLESNGYAVQLVGLRRSDLLRENIDELLANTAVTRQTLTLMYAADFYDQLERTIIPALRSGLVVLADRYIFTLTARAAARGVDRKYLENLYQLALRPDLTFWLTIDPKVAIERELKKASVVNYWEAGRDMNLSADLYESFTRYQVLLNREFERLSTRYGFQRVDGEAPVSAVNRELRRHIGAHLKIRKLRYTPSGALAHLWK